MHSCQQSSWINWSSSPLSPFLQIQSPSLISSSAAEHLQYDSCPLNLPPFLHFFVDLTPPLQEVLPDNTQITWNTFTSLYTPSKQISVSLAGMQQNTRCNFLLCPPSFPMNPTYLTIFPFSPSFIPDTKSSKYFLVFREPFLPEKQAGWHQTFLSLPSFLQI